MLRETSLIRIKVQELFLPGHWRTALGLVGAIKFPLIEALNEVDIERIESAVLRISQGSIEKLQSAIDLAELDWRDVLVAAEFANDLSAHKAWLMERSDASQRMEYKFEPKGSKHE